MFWTSYLLTRDEKAGSSIICSYHEIVFIILRGGSRISVLNVIRPDFGLFIYLFGRIPRNIVLKKLEVEDSWLIFMDQEQSILMRSNSDKDISMSGWMNKY